MPGTNTSYSTGQFLGYNTPSNASSAASGVSGGAAEGVSATSSSIPFSAYLGAGLGALQAYSTYKQNSQIKDTGSYEDLYEAYGNQIYEGSINDILSQRRATYLDASPSWKSIRLLDGHDQTTSAVTSAFSGAMAGSGFGPVGAAVGAVVGGISSLFGSKKGESKAKKEANRLAYLRSKAIVDNERNFLSGLKGAEQQVNFQALSNIAAFGGPLHTNGADWSNDIIFINSGGTHENNPYGGVPMGFDAQNKPNLLEEGEIVWNDYVFSNRIKVPKGIKSKYKLKYTKDMTFADAVKKAQKESEERPNDPISQLGLDSLLYSLAVEQEKIRANKESNSASNKFEDGGPRDTSLRYLPAMGLGVTAITDAFGITNKPDYSNAEGILKAAKEATKVKNVTYTPSGTYLTYKPFDTMFYSNQLAAQANASRRAIRNNANGNRMTAITGLLAADYNAQQQLGNLFRQAEEYNTAQKQKVTEFNNAINRANAEGFLKAAMANQETQAKANALGLEAQMIEYQLREKSRQASDSAKSSNLSNLLTSLSNIGTENANLNARDFRLLSGIDGPITDAYKDYLSQSNPFGWVSKIFKKKGG